MPRHSTAQDEVYRFGDLQVRAYVTSLSTDDVLLMITCLMDDTWYGDYGGTAPIDFYVKDVGSLC